MSQTKAQLLEGKSATIQFTGGSASAPSVSFTGDTNTGIYSPGADQVAISTNGTKRIEIQADGDIDIDNGGVFYDATNNRLAIGTTSPSGQLSVTFNGNSVQGIVATDTGTPAAGNYYLLLGLSGGIQNVASNEVHHSAVSALAFRTGSGNGSERARIDSAGRWLLGTSTGRNVADTIQSTLQVEGTSYNAISVVNNTNDIGSPALKFGKSRGTTNGSNTVVQNGDYLGAINFAGANGTNLENIAGSIACIVDATPGVNDMPGRLVFSTTADGASSPTERMRIGSAGSHSMYALNDTLYANTNRTAGTTYGLYIGRYGSTSTIDGTISFIVFSNGNVQNTNNSYGAYSDVKLKENISDAGSQWADLKSLRVRNYNLKEGQTHRQIGLIAQEVELVSPGLVSESPDRDADGSDLGTVTKSVNYSVLYMKAVKALQEAMERIETLEAKVAALESA